MKKILMLAICLLSSASFALTINELQHVKPSVHGCEQAPPTTDANFCNAFKNSANCHCSESGMDSRVCNDMNLIYSTMTDYFGSLEAACDFQQYQQDGAPKQVCIDDWNCYRNGGTNSQGGLCSSTGNRC